MTEQAKVSAEIPSFVEANPERLERLRSALGRVLSIAEDWQEAARVRREPQAVIDAFDQIKMFAHVASSEAMLLTYREPEPGEFERLLATPGEQFDKRGEVAATVLAAQRLADLHSPSRCPHRNTSTHSPGTIGGSPVTVCNDCGVYL